MSVSVNKSTNPTILERFGLANKVIKETVTTAANPLNRADTLLRSSTAKVKENPFSESQPKSKLVSQALNLYDRVDSDKNGILTKKELINKMQDSNIKGQESAIVGSMLKYHGDIKKLSNDERLWETGITKNDLKQTDKLLEKDELKNKFEGEYAYRLSKVNAVNPLRTTEKSVLKMPTKAEEINYKDLEQGQNGNCYFLAALASVAYNHPEKIVNMIKDNKDGTFNVKFAGKEVTVNAPTDTELGLYAEGKTWVPVIEKAYAEYRNRFWQLNNPHSASGQGTLITGRSIYELTGNSFDSDILVFKSHDTTREKLSKAVDGKKIVVASIEKEIFGNKNDLSLPDGHVYTILNYDKKSDMVTIRNPWGNGESQKEIAQAVKEQLKYEVDKKKIHIDDHIKTLGEYTVSFKLHPKVTANVKLVVEGLKA